MYNLNLLDDPLAFMAGPTTLPYQVALASAQPMISHRSAKFRELYAQVAAKAQQLMCTKQDVLLLTSSGSGGLEASISNFIAPGQKVLALSIGNFGRKYRDIAAGCGADVETIEFPWGQAVNLDTLKERLAQDTNYQIKAILVQQHETSTGVINPLAEIAAICANHPALLMVDAISGLAACPLQTDLWNLDIVVGSSQKALMTPPGLCLMTISPKAWASYQEQNPKSYFDLKRYQKGAEKNETPTTPAVSLFYGLNTALDLILEKGLEQNIAEHYQRRDMVRAAAKAINLKPVAQLKDCGGAITALYSPSNIHPKQILKICAEKYQVVLASGMGDLADTSFRFAHVGYMRQIEIISAIAAIELALKELGHDLELGSGVAAALQVLV